MMLNSTNPKPATSPDGGPAFPVRVANQFGDGYHAFAGMSLRDYFAGVALAKLIPSKKFLDADEIGDKYWDAAAEAYHIAEAMIGMKEIVEEDEEEESLDSAATPSEKGEVRHG